MRALTSLTQTATIRYAFAVATIGLLALGLSHDNKAEASPTLDIINFAGIDLGYYDQYSFAGTVVNAQDPTSLIVTIYINGLQVDQCTPDASGHFEIITQCVGGDVTAEVFESPVLASATITVS